MICWNCKERVEVAICVSCGKIQPPPAKMDFYSIFSLQRKYFIEKKDIESAYRTLSKKIHPDRFRKKSAVERRMSLQWTALVNEARRVLLDPILRARYLATGQAKAKERGASISQAFLEEIFELQMMMMSDKKRALQQVQQMYDENDLSLEKTFRAWEDGEGDLDNIEEFLGRWKYLSNILAKGEE